MGISTLTWGLVWLDVPRDSSLLMGQLAQRQGIVGRGCHCTLLLARVRGLGWSPCPPGSGRVSGWSALSPASLWARQVGFGL